MTEHTIEPSGLSSASGAIGGFTTYQKFVVAMLAFLQFTIVLDFMILSPLGAMLMPVLKITPSQFGLVVSAYAFSAGASGLLAAGFADRFDRKKLLLFFYCGFVLGTLCCALAPNYHFLLVARMVTGLFGGVIGSVVFAITTDLFPMSMRGRVMGFIQTAFAASQVLGIPFALVLSNRWGWHAPFHLIVVISLVVGVFIWIYLRPIDAHLQKHPDRSPLHHLWTTMSNPLYLQAFAAMALMSVGGFMLMPFSSAFTVHNLGITLDELPLVYMVTGICSIVAGPLVGRLSDSIGKFKVFCLGSLLGIGTVLVYTQLGVTPLVIVISISVLMFIGISSRMISASALVSGVPEPLSRGSFMSVSSSLQQMAGGLASILAGMIVIEGTDGTLARFDILGYVVVAAMLVTMAMMYVIHRAVARTDLRS